MFGDDREACPGMITLVTDPGRHIYIYICMKIDMYTYLYVYM